MKTSRTKFRGQQRGSIRVELLLLLVLLPFGGLLFVHAEKKRRQALGKLAGRRGSREGKFRERRAEFFLMMGAAAMIILALARPAWKEVLIDVSSEGRDVIFLLDVSRSMLAEDLVPNRLETAKTAIRDTVATLEGDRVALVVFSGSPSILCPLTTDYRFFLERVDEAHPDYVAPGDVRVGGTRIGDAIHKTADKLLDHERSGYQDLILISDGGDQESRPDTAAERLKHLGVYLIVVGVGDERRGARVPDREGGYTVYKDQEIWSVLEPEPLEDLAEACPNAVFLNAGTKRLALGEIYPKLVEHFRREQPNKDERMVQREETFPLFLGVAILLLASPFRRLSKMGGKKGLAGFLVFFGIALSGGGGELYAASAEKLFRTGCKQLKAGNFVVALETLEKAAEAFPDTDRSRIAFYNAGICCFKQAEVDEVLDPQSSLVYYGQAAECFRAGLEMKPKWREAAWNLELALVNEERIRQEIERQLNDEQPDDESQESQESDSEEGESDEEQEGDWEESEDEGASEPSDQMQGPNAMDLEAQDLPPPAVEPEELLQQEMETSEMREKNRSSNYKPVEKDW